MAIKEGYFLSSLTSLFQLREKGPGNCELFRAMPRDIVLKWMAAQPACLTACSEIAHRRSAFAGSNAYDLTPDIGRSSDQGCAIVQSSRYFPLTLSGLEQPRPKSRSQLLALRFSCVDSGFQLHRSNPFLSARPEPRTFANRS